MACSTLKPATENFFLCRRSPIGSWRPLTRAGGGEGVGLEALALILPAIDATPQLGESLKSQRGENFLTSLTPLPLSVIERICLLSLCLERIYLLSLCLIDKLIQEIVTVIMAGEKACLAPNFSGRVLRINGAFRGKFV